MIRAAEHATPDHLGRDLVSVLASLPEGKQRELVFYDTPDPYHQWLTARAWALRSETVHGDPREIKLFLDILDEPISPEPSEYLGALSSSRAASYERLVALLALTRAAFAGEPHRPRFLDFEKAALRHLGYSSYRDSAITLLAALDEHNALTQNAKMKFEQWIARPPYSIVLDKWIMTDKEYFYAQGPLNSPPTSSP